MTQAKHTPGPLYVERAADGQNLWVACPRYTVATVSSVADRVNIGETKANAALFAAAPELLDSLIYLRNCIEDGTTPAMREVNAAIAKATGNAT